MITTKKHTLISLSILLSSCLIAYWPLSFGLFSLKNDALNYFLPVRFQISEAISNGYFPFWSPYFNLGYPLHGDMQSGVWNPIVQIISLFGPYNLYTLQLEILLYIYLCGVSMFFCIRYFTSNWFISLFISASYMLCGYNSDSTQFLNWISGAAFLPFVFLFYYRALNEKKVKHILVAGFFLYMMFVAAYPAEFILTAYLLLFLLIWFLSLKENRSVENLKWQFKAHLILFIIFVLLSFPAIISYSEFLPLTERGSGANINEVLSNPLHPGLLFSYITPLPVSKADFASITDPLERNSYFGIFCFFLLLISFQLKEKGIPKFLKWGLLISLLFSFGEFGGIRIISYHLLPLMDTFRHPANSKIFSIFFACLLAGLAFNKIGNDREKINLQSPFLILAFIYAGLFIWGLFEKPNLIRWVPRELSADKLKSFIDKLSFGDLLLMNVLIQLPFLLIAHYYSVKKINYKFFVIAGILNSIILTAIIQPFTVIKKDTVSHIQNILDSVTQMGYPIPNINTSIKENSFEGNLFFNEIGAVNMYNKKIGRIDYRITPSNLILQNKFWNDTLLRNQLMSFPLIYKADTIITTDTSNEIKSEKRNKMLLFSDTNTNIEDINIVSFTPNKFSFLINSEEPGYYSIFQNHYPRWEIFINNKRVRPDLVNISFMGFYLPKGMYNVNFKYDALDIEIAFYISLITSVCLLLYLCLFRKRNYSNALDTSSHNLY